MLASKISNNINRANTSSHLVDLANDYIISHNLEVCRSFRILWSALNQITCFHVWVTVFYFFLPTLNLAVYVV